VSNPSRSDVVAAERLRYFYAGESRLAANQSDRSLVGLLTDSEFQAGGRQMADILSIRGQEHVYQYIFSYIGTRTNTEEWFGVSRPELGGSV
jgi:Carboxylesterase family